MELKYGFLETKNTDDETLFCNAHSCYRCITNGEILFIDVLSNQNYCETCGKCERYHRKRSKVNK